MQLPNYHHSKPIQHDGRRVADQRGRALQVGGDRDADEQRDRGDFQLLGDGQRDRRDHQDRRHVVNERGHDAGEDRQRDRHPHDVGRLLQQQVRHTLRHFRLDEQRDRAHRTGQHQKDVPVDGREDGSERHRAGDDKDDRRDQRDIRPLLGQGNHQDIRDCEEDDGEQLHDRAPNFSFSFLPGIFYRCPGLRAAG